MRAPLTHVSSYKTPVQNAKSGESLKPVSYSLDPCDTRPAATCPLALYVVAIYEERATQSSTPLSDRAGRSPLSPCKVAHLSHRYAVGRACACKLVGNEQEQVLKACRERPRVWVGLGESVNNADL